VSLYHKHMAELKQMFAFNSRTLGFAQSRWGYKILIFNRYPQICNRYGANSPNDVSPNNISPNNISPNDISPKPQ
jgi:hypothetical protein